MMLSGLLEGNRVHNALLSLLHLASNVNGMYVMIFVDTRANQNFILLGICIGCIVPKTNIHVCVVGTNVPTCI